MAKRKAAHEHHGGAWKVAYSDFITSMMALFMVLWILAQNVQVRESIQQYFLDPFSATVMRSPGVVTEDSNYPDQPQMKAPQKPTIDQKVLWELAQQFYRLMKLDVDDTNSPVDISLTDDGMFITLYNRDDQPIFVDGSVELTEWGLFVMRNVSWLLDRVDMPVRISSHVQSGLQFNPGYTAWELTSDMSNAVRRELERYGLLPEKVFRVTGFGSSMPVDTLEPSDQRNQRIELELTVPGTAKRKVGPTQVP